MKNLFKKVLIGDIKVEEYSTVTIEGEIKERVFLESRTVNNDVSKIQ
jgi:hypothetical protein